MNDLDLLVAGAMVTMIALAGAYINVRRRANLEPVTSHESDAVQVGSRPGAAKR